MSDKRSLSEEGSSAVTPETPQPGSPKSAVGGGVGHSKKVAKGREDISYRKAQDEKVIKHAGSYVVFGTDRPDSVRSGNGSIGADGANSIDLVVGRMATGGRKNEGVQGGTTVDNSIAADAARITISQLTNIDKNAHLAQGHQPNLTNRSGILIKADGVRIVGRDGVKIVTGKMDGIKGYGNKGETNSLGGEIRYPTIELIAGNITEDKVVFGGLMNPIERIPGLQPVPLGYVTRDALSELGGIIEDLHGSIFAMLCSQIVFNAVLSTVPFAPWITAASVTTVTTQLVFALESMWHIRVNKTLWDFNYLYPFGYKYICSRNVKIT